MRLSIEELTYSIGQFKILDQVTAEASAGNVIGIIGPNGAGKSTLANVLSGLIRPSSGRIALNGTMLTEIVPEQVADLGISRMFQDQHLSWNLSTFENVLAAAEVNQAITWHGELLHLLGLQVANRPVAQMAMQILERVGLIDQQDVLARNLSFGQQRLLALGRTLISQGRLVILDEPFTGLKSESVDRVLKSLREESLNRIHLIIDHSLSILREVATQIWYMHRGRLTVFDSFSSMTASSLFVESYLGYRETKAMDREVASIGIKKTKLVNGQHDDKARKVPRDVQSHAGIDGSGAPRLMVRSLSASYGTKLVVEDANIDLFRGEVLCIVGPNGVGKSTLLRALLGIVLKTYGTVCLDGKRLETLTIDQRVRMGLRLLPQDHRIFRYLSIKDNMSLSVAGLTDENFCINGLPLIPGMHIGNEKPQLSGLALNSLVDNSNRLAGTLSGGEQAQMALQLFHYGAPKVILLDEPTAGIDGMARSSLLKFIEECTSIGIAFIVVEHDINFVSEVASRVEILREGHLRPTPFEPGDNPEALIDHLSPPLFLK